MPTRWLPNGAERWCRRKIKIHSWDRQWRICYQFDFHDGRSFSYVGETLAECRDAFRRYVTNTKAI